MPVDIFAIIDRFPFVVVPRRTNIDLVIDPDAVAPTVRSRGNCTLMLGQSYEIPRP